jgi:hypothetical protein
MHIELKCDELEIMFRDQGGRLHTKYYAWGVVNVDADMHNYDVTSIDLYTSDFRVGVGQPTASEFAATKQHLEDCPKFKKYVNATLHDIVCDVVEEV